MDDQGGFVALAAQGDGREKGRVGLDQDAVGGRELGGVADGLRLRISQVAGEREVEVRRQASVRPARPCRRSSA